VTTTPTLKDADPDSAALPAEPRRRWHTGWIVAGSLATGFLAAVLLVLAPFVPARGSNLSGAILCGFALGWGTLAVLSVRFTDQPQRWAAAPAVFMGLGGLLLVLFGSSVQAVFSWIWPPAMLALAIWMGVQVRRQLRSRIGRWLLYSVIVILAAASIGGGYETVAEPLDARAHPMPGQLIDVGGHSLHLSCTGTGTPTVVLEPGAGEMSAVLGWITPVLARDTRVCVYDRAGRGWSEPSDSPQDGTQIATDLRTLLHRGDEAGPYLLAGHSFGGMYVQTFAALYPDEVAGMVLIDSTAPKKRPMTASTDEGDSYRITRRVSALVSSSARFGIGRLYGQLDYDTLPPASRDEARASVAKDGQLGSTIEEYVQGDSSMEQAGTLTSLGDKALLVLEAGSGSTADWPAKQEAMAALSTNSARRVIDGATHSSLISDEKYAAVTTQAILDVLASVKSGAPLESSVP
jgi:pimeloyl-ACP methyl ester carboxylesterase